MIDDASAISGRHHLLTQFQLSYLKRVTEGDRERLLDVHGSRCVSIVHSRAFFGQSLPRTITTRDAIRCRLIVASWLSKNLPYSWRCRVFVYLIDDIGRSQRFAEYVIKKIGVESQGRFQLTPGKHGHRFFDPRGIRQVFGIGVSSITS